MVDSIFKAAGAIGSMKIMGISFCILLISYLIVAGVVSMIPGGYNLWPFTNMKLIDSFDGAPMHGNPSYQKLDMNNEEVRKLAEMEEMNALGCSGGAQSEALEMSNKYDMEDYVVFQEDGNKKKKINPFAKAEGFSGDHLDGRLLNNTGLPGSELKSAIGAEVTGFINDNRQFPQFPQDQLDAEELLPKASSDQFAQMFPNGQGDFNNRKDFLTSAFHVGINTVGQTLKNANYQLRSDPPNPQIVVGPWNNTTITPDLNRRTLEIG